ncbi:MAG: hypothetical protein ABJL54_12195 [Halioglobus sp.]
MILTIWRHGEAGSAVTDRLRELTDKGRDDLGFACHQFQMRCERQGMVLPSLILFSEWLRTSQTAEIIANTFAHAACKNSPSLIPGRHPRDIDSELDKLLASNELPEHLVLVSHQPLVSSLVDYYLGEYGLVAPLLPGGLATVEMDSVGPACASLRFSAQPPHYEATP